MAPPAGLTHAPKPEHVGDICTCSFNHSRAARAYAYRAVCDGRQCAEWGALDGFCKANSGKKLPTWATMML